MLRSESETQHKKRVKPLLGLRLRNSREKERDEKTKPFDKESGQQKLEVEKRDNRRREKRSIDVPSCKIVISRNSIGRLRIVIEDMDCFCKTLMHEKPINNTSNQKIYQIRTLMRIKWQGEETEKRLKVKICERIYNYTNLISSGDEDFFV